MPSPPPNCSFRASLANVSLLTTTHGIHGTDRLRHADSRLSINVRGRGQVHSTMHPALALRWNMADGVSTEVASQVHPIPIVSHIRFLACACAPASAVRRNVKQAQIQILAGGSTARKARACSAVAPRSLHLAEIRHSASIQLPLQHLCL